VTCELNDGSDSGNAIAIVAVGLCTDGVPSRSIHATATFRDDCSATSEEQKACAHLGHAENAGRLDNPKK
jgi:hypothetical protein